jgi:neural Wiskott-Aldrich syndrome protein
MRHEGDPFDGGIAGAPYPEPDSVPPPRPVTTSMPVPVQRTKVPMSPREVSRELPRETPRDITRNAPGESLPVAREKPAPIELGQLAENIPRSMRAGRMEIVEVRIARAKVKALGANMQGQSTSYLHHLVVTKAMSVRLRAVEGSFEIETGSPETQWLDNNTGMAPEDFASWRWNVTPKRRGAGKLQLVVSARTIASDGLTADTALPDQVFDVTVKADYGRMFKRACGWAGLMILGGVLSKFGQNGLDTVATIWRGFE